MQIALRNDELLHILFHFIQVSVQSHSSPGVHLMHLSIHHLIQILHFYSISFPCPFKLQHKLATIFLKMCVFVCYSPREDFVFLRDWGVAQRRINHSMLSSVFSQSSNTCSSLTVKKQNKQCMLVEIVIMCGLSSICTFQ